MNVALIGYGATGKVISQLAPDFGIIITEKFTSEKKFTDFPAEDANVIIDFSSASAVVDNVKKAAMTGKNIVIGTTGWQNKFDEVRSVVEQSGIGCVYGSNFSVGANVFFRIVAESAQFADGLFDISISETHHRLKADSPSGTALGLAQIILEKSLTKSAIITGNAERLIEPHELQISSVRLGTVFGRHVVSFDGTNDTIELTHMAKSRNGFAEGALLAAIWLDDRKGMYNFSEHFLTMLAESNSDKQH